jgi:hypothetical protein
MNPTPKPSLIEASSYRGISSSNPFWFGNLIHLYLDLKLGMSLEGADGVENARRAQKYIRQAAEAAQVVCDVFPGQVLEIHGKTVHLGLEVGKPEEVEHQMKGAAALLHVLLERSYRGNGPSWRMAADHGMTLTVQSQGIHEDTSLVSLSPAANLPAKKLGKGAVQIWQLGSNVHGVWRVEDLNDLAKKFSGLELAEKQSLFESLVGNRASIYNFSALSEVGQLVTAQAAPVGEPTEQNMLSVHAMVMSADLDGFTARVAEAAAGSLDDKRRLAEDFLGTMRLAESFAKERKEKLIQFPFAGDNAIFGIVSNSADDYLRMKKVTPVEMAVAWEDLMGDRARNARYKGWAQVSAGGEKPHGNSKGNLHISGIRLNGRRFLIGIGPGMRFAREGFVQVNPSAKQLAMWKEDVSDLNPILGGAFESCPSRDADVSSVYKMASFEGLRLAMKKFNEEKYKSVSVLTDAKIPLATGTVSHRPHYRQG